MAGRRAAGRSFTFSGHGEAIVRRCVMLKLRRVLEEGRERVKGYKRTRC